MSRAVLLTDGAARDVDELLAAAYADGGAEQADLFMDRIQVAFRALARDDVTGEPIAPLQRLGMSEGRQVRAGPLRILVRIRPDEVHVVALCDDRKSMQSLLQKRMLDS